MALTRFDPPGFVDDLTPPQRAAWSTWVSEQLDEARAGAPGPPPSGGPRGQFFNPLTMPPGADTVEKEITWSAFPRIVKIAAPSELQRWRAADASRDRQDEYCEWSVARDPATHRILRVTFTSEGPEYWEFLAAVNPARVVDLYRQHVDPAVKREHLFRPDGAYERRNRWNNSTDQGVMHLIQRANTLGAEIELAGAATIVRRRNGAALSGERELIGCGRYGEPERFSDPTIGAAVNALARQRADVTLANPVGLYIAGLSVANGQAPGGADPLEFWKVTRGRADKAVRAVYEVPPGRGFTVGDLTIGGRRIEYGSQIADCITIKLTGLATRIGQSAVAPVDGCVGDAAAGDAVAVADAGAAVPPVASILARLGRPSR